MTYILFQWQDFLLEIMAEISRNSVDEREIPMVLERSMKMIKEMVIVDR